MPSHPPVKFEHANQELQADLRQAASGSSGLVLSQRSCLVVRGLATASASARMLRSMPVPTFM